jgi:Flp pilus assembly protein TadG
VTNFLCRRGCRRAARNAGSAAVEFAIVAPLLVALGVGVADYGAMMVQSSSLAAYARAGAEYVRAQVAPAPGRAGNPVPSAATVETLLNLPSNVTLTPAPAAVCTCADFTTPVSPCPPPAVNSPGNPCTGIAGLTDSRVIVSVSVTATISPFNPLIPYATLPVFPSSLSSVATIRTQ